MSARATMTHVGRRPAAAGNSTMEMVSDRLIDLSMRQPHRRQARLMSDKHLYIDERRGMRHKKPPDIRAYSG